MDQTFERPPIDSPSSPEPDIRISTLTKELFESVNGGVKMYIKNKLFEYGIPRDLPALTPEEITECEQIVGLRDKYRLQLNSMMKGETDINSESLSVFAKSLIELGKAEKTLLEDDPKSWAKRMYYITYGVPLEQAISPTDQESSKAEKAWERHSYIAGIRENAETLGRSLWEGIMLNFALNPVFPEARGNVPSDALAPFTRVIEENLWSINWQPDPTNHESQKVKALCTTELDYAQKAINLITQLNATGSVIPQSPTPA